MANGAVRCMALIFAVGWLGPGFGLIDLSVSWNAAWPVVLEAGWGVLFSLLVGAPLIVLSVHPRRPGPPIALLSIVVVALSMSAMWCDDRPLLVLAAVLTAQSAAVWLVGGRPSWRRATFALSIPLAALAVAAAFPLLLYSRHALRDDRRELPTDISLGVNHYTTQSALALATVLSAALLALAPAVRLLFGSLVGSAAAYLGLVSFCWPSAAGGWNRPWSVLTMAWGTGIAAVSVLSERRRRAPTGHGSDRSAPPASVKPAAPGR